MLIRDRLPAYITWERFEANQERLDGQPQPAEHARCARGTGRRCWPGWCGAGGAGGGWWCGTRGRRTALSYTCTRGSADYGEPLCQRLSTRAALDELVAGQLLAAVAAGGAGGEPGGGGRGRAGAGGADPAVAAAAGAGGDTRSIGRPGSTRRASRRTGWWPASWSAAGRRP